MTILAHIDDSLVSYTPGAPAFEQLVSDTLGNAGDSSDGFESDVMAVMMMMYNTDAMLADLAPMIYDLGTAVDAFGALDTAATFADALAAVPSLTLFGESTQLKAVGDLTLPDLPPIQPGGPPVPPPTVCVPAPAPPEPPPPPVSPLPCPAGTTYNPATNTCDPCPPATAWASTPDGRNQCAPITQPPPPEPPPPEPPPPTPPPIIPPVPIGLPPCPESTAYVPGVPCQPTGTAGPETVRFVLALGDQIVSFITAQEMTTAAVGWVMSFGLTTLTAIPIAGAIIAVGALIISFLGGGCGDACINASKLEQLFEAAATNLLALGRYGMLTKHQVIVGIFQFIQVGMRAVTQLGTMAGQQGATNLNVTLMNLRTAANSLATERTQPIDIATARTMYAGGPGWYADSITAANALTDQYLVGLGATVPTPPAQINPPRGGGGGPRPVPL